MYITNNNEFMYIMNVNENCVYYELLININLF